MFYKEKIILIQANKNF